MAALKGRILVFENTQLAYTKTTSWSRTRKYLFIWRGTFNCFLLIIHILLCFSLNSYCSCHWWFYLLMWLRVKEEIWIDWIYCTGTLIPVKFHIKVIAIGYWLANFSWFQIHPWKLKDFLLFGCNAYLSSVSFYKFKQILFQWSGCPKPSWKSVTEHYVQQQEIRVWRNLELSSAVRQISDVVVDGTWPLMYLGAC